ncbi:hypothetical protein ASD37_25720 [Mycobacterium sp. Root135]|nr:hypothetical protein ASD37_25720 [Mycobacterium sp. Root135]
MTQVEVAANLGVGQAQVSKVERQARAGDMFMSTLASYLAALGASAEIAVLVNGQTMRFDLTPGRGKR